VLSVVLLSIIIILAFWLRKALGLRLYTSISIADLELESSDSFGVSHESYELRT